MASFFISHASRDRAVAERIRSWLVDRGYTSIFLDFDPEQGIPPGRQWESELYSQLRRADVLIFVGTAAAVDSRWCHTELAMSRSLGRTILPLRLDGAASHPLVADRQWISLKIDGADGLQPLQRALERLEIDALDTLDWDATVPPYPGLEFFDENRAGVFYGRTEEIAAVLEQLRRPHARGTERLLLVAGASGCGKSSLVRAGVLPRLRRLERSWLVAQPMLPRGSLRDALVRGLASMSGEPPDEIQKRLLRDGLASLAQDLVAARSAWGAPAAVVVIDQAEQLTQYPDTDRLALLELLARGLVDGSPLRVVATLRSEYLSELLAGSALEGAAAPVVSVGRLSAERLAEVIEEPARRAGVDLDRKLVRRMVQDTTSGATGGDPLPLLAFTLRQLWESPRADSGRIGEAEYERVGGVVGALKAEADRTFEQLTREGLGAAVVPTLLELVHVDPQRDPAGRSVPRSRFDPEGNRVLDAFIEARLLTSAEDEPSVSVAHEALLREWRVIAAAIDSSRDRLVARARLERDAGEWDASGRDPSYLARGQRLQQARAALAPDTRAADPVLAAFVDSSVRHARRQAWRARALLAVGLAAAGIAVGGYLLVERIREGQAKDGARAALVPLPGGGAVDVHEVTNGQYQRCVDWGDCARRSESGGLPRFVSTAPDAPVFNIDATQAAAFCVWIGRRLPTRSELREAAGLPGVTHLFSNPGGQEWTSTPFRGRLWTVLRNPDGSVVVQDVDPVYRDFQTTFRCARR